MRGADFELFVSRIVSLSQKQRGKLLDLLQQSTRQLWASIKTPAFAGATAS
jgi:hypothetical protein